MLLSADHFDGGLSDHDLDVRTQVCEKEVSVTVIKQSSVSLDGIWLAVKSCWPDEFHTHVFLSNQCFWGEILS